MRVRPNLYAARLVCAAIVLLTCHVGHAQDYRAKIQGVVTDSSQGAISDAKVALLNANTGISTAKIIAVNGFYAFDFVEPGTYTLSVEHPCFSKFTQTNIQVQVRGDVTVDASLNVGPLAEMVNVQASAVTLQFNTSTMELTAEGVTGTSTPATGLIPVPCARPAPSSRARSTHAVSAIRRYHPKQYGRPAEPLLRPSIASPEDVRRGIQFPVGL